MAWVTAQRLSTQSAETAVTSLKVNPVLLLYGAARPARDVTKSGPWRIQNADSVSCRIRCLIFIFCSSTSGVTGRLTMHHRPGVYLNVMLLPLLLLLWYKSADARGPAGACFMAPLTDFSWHRAWTVWRGCHSVRAEKNFFALGIDIMSALAFKFSSVNSQSNFTPDRYEYQPPPFSSEGVFQRWHLQ